MRFFRLYSSGLTTWYGHAALMFSTRDDGDDDPRVLRHRLRGSCRQPMGRCHRRIERHRPCHRARSCCQRLLNRCHCTVADCASNAWQVRRPASITRPLGAALPTRSVPR